PLQPQQPFP
nr:Chain C, peptide PRO-LEU-GLN-PRO-GLN-GLN-PRO-PHE-PRO [Homo sapiens]5IG7_F Chain F, peptide PRO-LEU-GLN-PRO-GLN-GLN-PRO-PHE-PRO [Homo sapiens]5IG7_I Chain I, peptide PRO-LEU-GLN-PRO-GLN-GLN-PRO-PHE-PRO [Homo sapiens]5IG7_L Chain L, peptide PRO-LEU-GLN-PRO-GLN-GLN-PRO-PHE-PRO [Homo sapiens]